MAKIQTSVIGSYPRYPQLVGEHFNPRWLLLSGNNVDWASKIKASKDLYDQAVRWAVRQQEEAGLDIVSDGEQRRSNYILYHCQHLNGFDFKNKEEKSLRGGKVRAAVPVIRTKVTPKYLFLGEEFLFLKSLTSKQIKMTIPGPLTIIDSVKNGYYTDEKVLAFDLARAIHQEIESLAKAGCKIIQIDEPVFIREPEKFLEYGLAALEMCFEGIKDVTIEVHICRGYPNKERDTKAEITKYSNVIEALSRSSIDGIAIEDAHEHLNLEVFRNFGTKRVILGVIDVGNEKIETVNKIKERVQQVLSVVPSEKLFLAPDCGLLLLPPEVAKEKLINMVLAAKSFG